MAQILHVNLVRGFDHERDILRLKITAQGHLETLKNMEKRLGFAFSFLCLFYYYHYYFYHKTNALFFLISLNSKNYKKQNKTKKRKKKKEVFKRAIQFTQF